MDVVCCFFKYQNEAVTLNYRFQLIKLGIKYHERYNVNIPRTYIAILDIFIVYGSHLGYHTLRLCRQLLI